MDSLAHSAEIRFLLPLGFRVEPIASGASELIIGIPREGIRLYGLHTHQPTPLHVRRIKEYFLNLKETGICF